MLKTLQRYKPHDAYAIIGLTNEDLYPSENYNFCFGWSAYSSGVGAFSFFRFNPDLDGIEDPNQAMNSLRRACHIMVNELCHMFGLENCIYYECLMNGVNCAIERRAGGVRVLCPVCLKKLKYNIKFDTEARFTKLAEVCDEIGFSEEAKIYRALIEVP